MCKELCDDAEDGYTTCQDCGAMICWDVETGDDVMRSAYVTASADLYCDRCGRQHDQAEEDEMEDFDFEEEFPEEIDS